MSWEIYNADFTNRHELTHAISIQTTRCYNDIGKFQIVVLADDYNINAVEVGGMIYDTDTEETYTIQNVVYDTANNHITMNGYTSNWLLNKRVVASSTTFTEAEHGVYEMVRNNLRQLPHVVVGEEQGLNITGDWTVYGEQLLDQVIDVLDADECGHKMVWNPDELTWTFEIYKGADLTQGMHAVVFSEEQGTAAKLKITQDNSVFKNSIYIPCEYNENNNSTTWVEVVSAEADDFSELWIKSNLTKEEDETLAQMQKRAVSEGNMQIGKHKQRQSFEIEVDSSDLGVAYNIGDMIACASGKFKTQFMARITGVTYKLDVSGATTTLTLGEPTLTIIEELKLNG